MSARRLVAAVSLTAVLAAGGGFVAAQFLKSPADRAAELAPPSAGPVTVPVIKGPLTSTVVTRGDVGFNDTTKITIAPGSGGAGVITGKVPKVGTMIDEGMVILEVSGRPVIALAGSTPNYRTLQPGSEGADVKQLQRALERLGYDPGEADGTYDSDTADAVAELYRDLGYEPPEPAGDKAAAEKSAKERLASAKAKLTSAKKTFAEIKKGPKRSERLSAEGQVDQARAQLAKAKQQQPKDEAAIDAAENQLAIAKAQLKEMLAKYEGDAEREAVDQAEEDVEDAEEDLAEAAAAAATPLPQSEVVVLPKLPRRADEVSAKLGAAVSGSVMTVAGTEPRVVAAVTAAEAELLKKGMKATLELPDGTEIPAKITKIEDGDEHGRKITLAPDKITAKQAADLRGANVKVTVSVGNSDGEVLSVPSAALFSTADGATQVEVQTAEGGTRMQPVRTGLTADGQTEVHPVGADGKDVEEGPDTLTEGSLVVVGR
ncbi:peptidoglycan-binding protein [Microlunatus parietis]|uniref:Peptidoglycan hydrolase-like protein with peptidoglycan-binding domain n=1 Tax=Microlunatus parietis TaxID=682979 RepID=A0A7Y9IE45_9ACTN|nr:peptidoglycan-binding protein [Microlunatus parietis]NYE75207.1 peptidoglycan hydrolase-like protein with peptidoglycan-binding domain [Microlunatus parietis]